jgi:hypothetical protein
LFRRGGRLGSNDDPEADSPGVNTLVLTLTNNGHCDAAISPGSIIPVQTMKLTSGLTSLCDMLRTQTGAQVILGCPVDGAAGIYVWPWKLEEDVQLRNAAVGTNPVGMRAPAASARNVNFLVLVRPALTPDGLSKLDEARQAILDHPILQVGGQNIRIILSPLAVDELAALFSAASIPLTICLSATLREIP